RGQVGQGGRLVEGGQQGAARLSHLVPQGGARASVEDGGGARALEAEERRIPRGPAPAPDGMRLTQAADPLRHGLDVGGGGVAVGEVVGEPGERVVVERIEEAVVVEWPEVEAVTGRLHEVGAEAVETDRVDPGGGGEVNQPGDVLEVAGEHLPLL